jgi:hypothetical protein
MMLRAYGFEIESMYDWKGRLAGRPLPGLKGYAKGKRATLRCRSRAAAKAAGWEPVAPLKFTAAPPRQARGRQRTPAPAPQPVAGWRGKVNQVLTEATGFELRRASGKR